MVFSFNIIFFQYLFHFTMFLHTYFGKKIHNSHYFHDTTTSTKINIIRHKIAIKSYSSKKKTRSNLLLQPRRSAKMRGCGKRRVVRKTGQFLGNYGILFDTGARSAHALQRRFRHDLKIKNFHPFIEYIAFSSIFKFAIVQPPSWIQDGGTEERSGLNHAH